MPLSHACRACGCALTHIRAPLDPSLGLPVVVCPECRTADVRRCNRIAHGVRRARLAMTSALSLAAKVVALLLLVGGSIGFAAMILGVYEGVDIGRLLSHLLGRESDPDVMVAWINRDGPPLTGVFIAWASLVGVVLAAGWSHVRNRSLVFAWWGAMLLGVFCFAAAIDWADTFRPRISNGQALPRPPDQGEFGFAPYLQLLGTIAISVPFMLPGVVVGRVVRRFNARRRAWSWCRLLTRTRKQRARA